MGFTGREIWTIIHGMGLGGLLLLVFVGALVWFWSLRTAPTHGFELTKHLRILTAGLSLATVLAWLTVITGTYLSYPWYRATPPPNTDISLFPMAYLLSKPGLVFWEDYAMEWKEHLAWFAPIFMTAATSILIQYRGKLSQETEIRKAVMILLLIAFIASGIAGFVGALVTKIAPIH